MSAQPALTRAEDGTLTITKCHPAGVYVVKGAVLLELIDEHNALVRELAAAGKS